MASVNKLHFLSHSSSLFSYLQKPACSNSICSVQYKPESSSPFTEKHSIERYQRDSWVYTKQSIIASPSCSLPTDCSSVRENDIDLQLPELKKLLHVLREKRRIGDGGERMRGPGNVFLVGTGPGDPELLTLKALKVIQNADLLLYDRLVAHDVLDLVGPNARLLYVGKTAGYHSRTQVRLHTHPTSFLYIFFYFFFLLKPFT